MFYTEANLSYFHILVTPDTVTPREHANLKGLDKHIRQSSRVVIPRPILHRG